MPILTLVIALPGFEPNPNEIRLTRKFLDGVEEYVKHWPGSVHVIMPPGNLQSGNLDDIILAKDQLSFTVEIIEFSSSILRQRLTNSSLVIGSPHHQLADLSQFCKTNKIPYIYVCEYTLKTRLQIAYEEIPELMKRAKQTIWEIIQEYKNIQQVRSATGVQCNGMPTFNSYKKLNREIIYYFDNRIEPEMLANELTIEKKYNQHFNLRPIQLAYSGRLNKMKGAHYLIPFAVELKKLGLNFQFHIFGGGELTELIQHQIQLHALTNQVTLHGTVNFKSELIPYITKNIDIFICPHPQGDPSCTYIETFACGVPILGFANEALEGLLAITPAGWSTAIGDLASAALKVQQLQRDAEEIKRAATAALQFAKQNTFEIAFQKRIDQMIKLSNKN